MAKIAFLTLNNLKSPSKDVVEKAFNIVYKEYSYLVFYVIFQIVKDNDLALELTNETFTNFFINKDNIKSSKNIKYYLVTTGKNLAINKMKKDSRIIELNDNYTYEESINDDFNSYIEKFKEFLTKEEIDLIVYHLLYDFSFKEIAKSKQTTVNVISSKYKRTIDKIKKHYKENK